MLEISDNEKDLRKFSEMKGLLLTWKDMFNLYTKLFMKCSSLEWYHINLVD